MRLYTYFIRLFLVELSEILPLLKNSFFLKKKELDLLSFKLGIHFVQEVSISHTLLSSNLNYYMTIDGAPVTKMFLFFQLVKD